MKCGDWGVKVGMPEERETGRGVWLSPTGQGRNGDGVSRRFLWLSGASLGQQGRAWHERKIKQAMFLASGKI